MRKLFHGTMSLVTLGLVFIYLLSCFSALISPAHFSPIALLGLAFPYLFLAMLFFTVANFFRDKKVALVLLVLTLPGIYNLSHILAFHPHKFQMEKDSRALRVLTWNVEGFSNRLLALPQEFIGERILGIIKEYNPDIICMQEFSPNINTFNGWENTGKIFDSLGYKGSFIISDSIFWEGKIIGINSGLAIFTHLPLQSKFAKVILEEGPRTQRYISADLATPKGILRIKTGRLSSLNLYMDTAHMGKNIYEITMQRKRLVQHQIRSTEKLHQYQIGIIRKDIEDSPYPVLYCGDMNSVPTSYNYYMLKGKNLQDAFLKGGWGIGASFYNIVPTLRIDYIFPDKRFKVLQSKVIREKLSDHYPVVSDIIQP